MERILLMVLRCLYKVPEWWYKICYYGRDESFKKYSEEKRYELLKEIVTKVNRSGKVNVICTGAEKLPKDDGYILFSNHQGMFDTLMFFETHGRPFSIVFKKEVANVILVKQIAHLIQAKSMDREDVRQSMRVIKSVADEVKQGRNYLIFPEGTRSRLGNKLVEFKNGAFKSAVYAKCPIVPVAIIDSFKPFDSHSTEEVTTQIHYLEPIPYEVYKGMKTPEIGAMVRAQIEEAIAKYSGEEMIKNA